jgi:hypothetical protein
MGQIQILPLPLGKSGNFTSLAQLPSLYRNNNTILIGCLFKFKLRTYCCSHIHHSLLYKFPSTSPLFFALLYYLAVHTFFSVLMNLHIPIKDTWKILPQLNIKSSLFLFPLFPHTFLRIPYLSKPISLCQFRILSKGQRPDFLVIIGYYWLFLLI